MRKAVLSKLPSALFGTNLPWHGGMSEIGDVIAREAQCELRTWNGTAPDGQEAAHRGSGRSLSAREKWFLLESITPPAREMPFASLGEPGIHQ